ncbi:diphosphate--fructose-6-phosphate 1-phosphotransferase (or 6-phosphofructokinase) [Candidatus Sulfopaludibacter sp. SbA3]|nr:diphosphate--fructose-6-phosphate 1-phosphotransferase (or 6-phosphofructokinase) [Candidatus Sulfopaludibacter sp. SbA3]
MKAILVHSGGPTPVINASMAGVVEEARQQSAITGLYGAAFGLGGLLKEQFVDLFAQSAETMSTIADSPSSALGTSRLEVGPAEIDQVLRICRGHDIRYLFYTGGNGSMAAAAQIASAAGDGLQVIGIPKTIDNDLLETDHTPGYATTARFFACAVRDIGADNRTLPGQVEFVEVLGRNAGWLVAATSLVRHHSDDAPHLVYFPEVRLPLEQLLDDVDRVFGRLGRCVVAVCEGQLDQRGEAFGADERAGSRGKLAMNLGHRLATLVGERLKLRARSEKPGLLGRSWWSDEPRLDRAEARLCGVAAVRAACEGRSGVMVTLVRDPGPAYHVSPGLAPLEKVASGERLFPAEWRNAAGNDVMPAFRDYVAPLAGTIPSYPRLNDIHI